MEHNIKERESGVELLKIISIFMIVLYHIIHTLSSQYTEAGNVDYFMDLNVSTTNLQNIILILLSYLGSLGNIIFFICSAWFLCENERKTNVLKIFRIIFDVWIISIIYLLLFIAFDVDLSIKNIITSIFPTLFGNNWYTTCYLLFYAIFPYLNIIVRKISKKELLQLNMVLALLYYFISFVYSGAFFVNNLILFITMYFFVAYIKYYLNSTFSKVKFILFLLAAGTVGYIGIVLLTNFIGLKIDFAGSRVLYWAKISNPFLFFIAISVFHLFWKKRFYNRFVNRVASLSLLIYLIHENILFRRYFRPWIFHLIYVHLGYGHILLWVFMFAVVLFFGVGGGILSIPVYSTESNWKARSICIQENCCCVE